MIELTPRWESPHTKSDWYGHLHLLGDCVLGTWFCLERADGRLRWERTHRRANNIVGVDDGIIVASEWRSDGPWTATFGCYGISVVDGRMVWNSPREGLWGAAVRAFDAMPGFTNDLRDDALEVRDHEVICRSGRILKATTGKLIRREPRAELEKARAGKLEVKSMAQRLYENGISWGAEPAPPVEIRPGLWLSHRAPKEERAAKGFDLYLWDEQGEVRWHWSLASTGMAHGGNFYSYRLMCDRDRPVVYLMANEKGHAYDLATKPSRYRLLTIDALKGEVLQDVLVDPREIPGECRIEDIDEQGILITRRTGDAAARSFYFERMGG